MNNKRNEISYYSEITTFIEAQLKSNFLSLKNDKIEVYWGIGELKKNLLEIISKNPEKCMCVNSFANTIPPLSLDIFALITNGVSLKF